jgi:16S rRNA (cytosine1402-N4)-methyltransferase
MDQQKSRTAAEVVNTYPEEKLVEVLRTYGEVKSPHRIANLLVKCREEAPIQTTFELIEALMPLTPRHKEYRFQAQVFQAIRMEVNQELQVLEELLEQCTSLIKPGGRLVIITYHSLEDRLVKHYLRTGNAEGKLEKDFFGNPIRPFKPTQSKPITPTESELELNNRSRSAKLRIAERLDTPKQAR